MLGLCLLRARRYDEAIEAGRKARAIFDARGEDWKAGLARGIVWRAKIDRFRKR